METKLYDSNPFESAPPIQTDTISTAAISQSFECISIDKPISKEPIFRPHKSVYQTLLLNDIRIGKVDLKSPTSLIAKTGLGNLLTLDSFNHLTQADQQTLVKLLPAVDQDVGVNLEAALNNSYFKKYCEEWCESLSKGDLMNVEKKKEKTTLNKPLKRAFSSTLVDNDNNNRMENIMKMDVSE